MARKKGAFTDTQRLFVAEYLRNGCNCRQAAITIGCSPNHAHAWLTAEEYAHVKAAIDEQLAAFMVDAQAVRQLVFTDLLKMVRANPGRITKKILKAMRAKDEDIEAALTDEELENISSLSVSNFQDEGISVKVRQANRKFPALMALLKNFGQELQKGLDLGEEAAKLDGDLDELQRKLDADLDSDEEDE